MLVSFRCVFVSRVEGAVRGRHVLHCFTDCACAPHGAGFVAVSHEAGAEVTHRLAAPDAACHLLFQCFCLETNEFGQEAWNACGSGSVPLSGVADLKEAHPVPLFVGMQLGLQHPAGHVKLLAVSTDRPLSGPARSASALGPGGLTAEGRALGRRLMRRADEWWRGSVSGEAIHRHVADVHLPSVGLASPVPAWAFMAHRPVGDERESFFVRLFAAAARRLGKGLDGLSDAPPAQLAPVLAEALQLVPNTYVYMADFARMPGGEKLPADRFSSTARITGVMDCEDAAKEVLMLADSLLRGTWTDPLVRAMQACRRAFVVLFVLGAVTRDGSVRLEDAAYDDFESHAFLLMLPARAAAAMLSDGCRVARADLGAPLLQPRVIDGTAIVADADPAEDPRAAALMREAAARDPATWKRVKCRRVLRSFHRYALQSLNMGELCTAAGVPVYETYFEDPTSPNVYGVHAGALFAQDPAAVRMTPTDPAGHRTQDAQTLMAARHPVLPHGLTEADQRAGGDRVSRARSIFEALGANVQTPEDAMEPPADAVAVYVGAHDCQSPTLLRSLAVSLLAGSGPAPRVWVDSELVSSTAFGLVVRFI